jgi:shikimate kinase
MNVVLTGFMGAGKTTTGRRLAHLLRLPFIDTDAEIERRFGPVAQIFQTQGEAAFRRIESAVVKEVASAGPAIIAVGGGAVLDPKNRLLLRRRCYIVYLAVSSRSAYKRVARRRHRPLLGAKPQLPTVAELLRQRAQAYADCDLVLRVDRKTPAQAAKIIARWYGDMQSRTARP